MFHGASSLACRQTIVPPWVPAEQTKRRCDPQWQKEYSEDNNEHAKLLDLVTLFAHVVGHDPCQRQSIHRLDRRHIFSRGRHQFRSYWPRKGGSGYLLSVQKQEADHGWQSSTQRTPANPQSLVNQKIGRAAMLAYFIYWPLPEAA
jgi:hypothetical protein